MGQVKKKFCNAENNSQKSSRRLLEDDVKCPVCLYILVEPVTMPCKHSACKACFLGILKQTALQCPVCRCRVGNFARNSMKVGKLINAELWTTIQEKFEKELLLQQLNSSVKVDTEDISVNPAKPGEIREEFEKQIVQLHEANKDKDRLEQEEKDKRIAAALHDALNSPASLTRLQTAKEAAREGESTKNTCVLQNDNSLTQGESFGTPQSSVAAPHSEERNDSGEGDCSDEEAQTSDKSSSRQLFQNLTRISGNRGNKQRLETRKRKVSPGKENGEMSRKKKCFARAKKFPGCHKRPKLSGIADLPISCASSGEDKVIEDAARKNANKLSNIKKTEMTYKRGKNSQSVQLTKSTDLSTSTRIQKHESSGSEVQVMFKDFTEKNQYSSLSLKEKEFGQKQQSKSKSQCAKGQAHKGSSCSQPKNTSSSGTTSGIADASVAAPDPAAASAASSGRESDHLHDDALSLLQDMSANGGRSTAVVAEQRALEARLRQEAQDAKLARRLQRHLATVAVDRTQGSGEEYQLRPRKHGYSSTFSPTAGAARGPSPCY